MHAYNLCLPYEMIPKANIEEMQMTSSTSRITKEATRDFFLETNTFTLQKATCPFIRGGIGYLWLIII